MSIRMKLISLVGAFVLVLGLVITGVLAASSQTITMNGSVNFNVTDKSLWVKEVRMQEAGSDPVVVSNFTPGYINGDFNFNVGNFENNHGSFAIYFDIINTTTYSYIVTVDYSELSSSVSGVEVYITNMITANSETITEITSTTEVTTTLELQVINPNLAEIDLSMITINIYNGVLGTLTYSYNSATSEATVTDCSEGTEVVIIPETVEYEEQTYAVTTIGTNAFSGCSSLTAIIIPESVTRISNFAFHGCSSLISINLPPNVGYIGERAFAGCNSLTSITLPSNIKGIGLGVFYDCSSLTTMIFLSVVPPTLGAAPIPTNVINIYVPAESVDAYKTASVWSSYADKITAII